MFEVARPISALFFIRASTGRLQRVRASADVFDGLAVCQSGVQWLSEFEQEQAR
jgi:hypothetical protein